MVHVCSVIHIIMCNTLACISDPVIVDRNTLHTVCFVRIMESDPLLPSNSITVGRKKFCYLFVRNLGGEHFRVIIYLYRIALTYHSIPTSDFVLRRSRPFEQRKREKTHNHRHRVAKLKPPKCIFSSNSRNFSALRYYGELPYVAKKVEQRNIIMSCD